MFISQRPCCLDHSSRFPAILSFYERLGDQLRLLDVEANPKQTDKLNGLPFPMMVLNNVAYKIGAIVTNKRSEDAT